MSDQPANASVEEGVMDAMNTIIQWRDKASFLAGENKILREQNERLHEILEKALAAMNAHADRLEGKLK